MADYGKFSLSAPFAALLAEFIIEDRGVSGSYEPVITHNFCGAVIYNGFGQYDEALNMLVQAAIDHNCDT